MLHRAVTAIQTLASEVGFAPEAARVHQLDLASTMYLSKPVSSYLPLLGSIPRYRKNSFGDSTVSFVSRIKTLTFYDKGKESRLDTEGMLRYEINYKKKLRQQLGWSVFLSDMYDPDRYSYLVGKMEKRI